jgi:uridine kinase
VPGGLGQNVGVATARVIVLAGPSGAGKSRLAERLGMPILRLDDFYKSAGDAGMPVITEGANAGIVDWDHPDSWLRDEALDAIRTLCAEGRARVPVYEIARDGRYGEQLLDLDGHRRFVAEGIFAQEVVPQCEREGLLEAAYCVTQHPLVTFWRRLTRDLRERRKPPLVLLRRGWSLLRSQREVVRHAVSLGCRQVRPDEAFAEIREREPVGRG